MEAVVQVMEAEVLIPLMEIPPAMLHKRVEVTVRPVENSGQPEENIAEKIAKFRIKYQGETLREYVKQKSAEGIVFDFDAQKVIDGAETDEDRQYRYRLGKQAWAQHIRETSTGE
ncbi:MAG: hypothetical protein LBN21_04050 [Treponema sp.]|jgi:hypothetical protein|nr:hypothetical protein [Treponema sp.]